MEKLLTDVIKSLQNIHLGQRLFALPLRIVKESYVPYELSEGTGYDADAMKLHLSALLDAGTDGQVLQQSFTEAGADGLFVVTLRAHCLENIAVDRTINW